MNGKHSQGSPGPDRRIDRAWWILLGAGLCIFCGQPAVLLFTFGVFVPEVVAATHWNPVTIAAAIAPGTILAALMAPGVGYAADRYGVRRLAMIGGPTWGLGLILLGLMPQSAGGFIGYLALACALGFAGTPVLYAHLVTGWFSRRRGLALSVMFGCSSLGVGSWSPIAASLMHLGWRNAYAIIGLAAGSIILFSSVFLLRNSPRASPQPGQAFVEGFTLREAIKTSTFWRIAIVFMLLTGALGGGSVNLPVILRQNHLAPETAASIMTVVGISMFCGMVSVGILLDRWFAPYVTAAFALLPLAAFTLLLFNHSTPAFFFAAAGIGCGLGSELNAAAYIVSRAFGVRAFGAIYGLITLAFGLTTATGPALVGAALAKSANLNLIFGCAVALMVAAIGILLTLKPTNLPFRPPARAVPLRVEPGTV